MSLPSHDNIHVRGYKEEGTTTTPFDMVVLNNVDRYQLALDAIRRIPRLADRVEAETARYETTLHATSSTSANTATTCRRCGTGAGRFKRSAVAQDQAAR